ncbi:DUF2726 domain-containing protein [Catenovulum sp. 2E275]|uniref:DUF2726 domain-containing protein n=1 Tax=Catenovulum sp. 2E275 TaxID=2980497 RepID=UPI0021D1C977|nr:DUF2726 domain-containing protein [Catenovulum sp. 2E275]MCU4676819.1 DUF2726 domain-containing protein [Catenovulum sp. 2E275]
MNIILVFAVFIILLAGIFVWQKIQQKKEAERFEFIHKFTQLELNPRQQLHLLLQQILTPEYRIHCQVSLACLINADDKIIKRNALKKLIDFVVTDKNNQILALIELDLRDAAERKNDWVLNCLKGQHSFIRIKPQKQYDAQVIAEHLQTVCGLAVR